MSGLQESSALQIFYCRVLYFDAALLLLACLPCVVVRTSVTALQTGCGRSDFGDAQAEMHSSPLQRELCISEPEAPSELIWLG